MEAAAAVLATCPRNLRRVRVLIIVGCQPDIQPFAEELPQFF
jgi:hypothetical protein